MLLLYRYVTVIPPILFIFIMENPRSILKVRFIEIN